MNTEHDHSILHWDASGYITFCNCCKSFQLSFGNIHISQTVPDFESFAPVIGRLYNRHYRRKDRKCRDIYLASPCEGMGLLFSINDLEQLNHMLQKALLIAATKDKARLQ